MSPRDLAPFNWAWPSCSSLHSTNPPKGYLLGSGIYFLQTVRIVQIIYCCGLEALLPISRKHHQLAPQNPFLRVVQPHNPPCDLKSLRRAGGFASLLARATWSPNYHIHSYGRIGTVGHGDRSYRGAWVQRESSVLGSFWQPLGRDPRLRIRRDFSVNSSSSE